MKQIRIDEYTSTAVLLMLAAAAFIIIALVKNRGDSTTAAFVIAGMVLAMTGIFILTFFGAETVDPRLVRSLSLAGSRNVSRIMLHFDIRGEAYFLPARITGETRVLQFNPISTQRNGVVLMEGSSGETNRDGLMLIPSCDPLIRELRKKGALVIPNEEEGLTFLLRETIEDFFRLAPRVSVNWQSNFVSIRFHGHPSIDCCKEIAQESGHYCTMNPCPLCSLCGTLIAEGLDRVVIFNKCLIYSSASDVTAIFSILPQDTAMPRLRSR